MFKFLETTKRSLLALPAAFLISTGVFVALNTNKTFAISEQTLIALTNNERAGASLAPLSWNAALSSSAWQKAQDMCAKGYWAHTAPDGATPWTFMNRAGYNYINAGENLARDFASDSAVTAGWMASPGHRANIMNANYKEVGIASTACSLNGAATSLVVAHYGSTAAAKAAAPAPVAKPAPKAAAPAPVATAPKVASVTTVTPKAAEPVKPVAEQPVIVSEAKVVAKPAAKNNDSFLSKLLDLLTTSLHGLTNVSVKLV